MTKAKRLSVRAASLLCAQLALAMQGHAAERASNEQFVDDPADKRFYAKYGSFDCGSRHVSIITLCDVDGVGNVPFCFDQSIDMTVAATHWSRAVSYAHGWREGEPQAVVALSCQAENGIEYLVVESTNFGSCGSCEWRDVYTLKGDYIESDGEPGRDLAATFRKLPLGFLDRAVEQARIDIERNP